MGLHKILRIIAMVLAVIGIIFALIITSSEKETLMQDGSMVDNMMYVTYLIFAITLVLVLFFVIKGLFAGNIKKTVLSLGLFFGIFIVSYLIASGTDLDLQPFIDKGQDVTEATSKYVGTGLNAVYTFGVLAIGAMLLSGIKKIVS